MAFVTNHGYLDNPTFRGMRCGLLETFPYIDVVDLHGNVKHGAAERDESVFTTQQGMALSLLIAPPECKSQPVVRRADLRGPRAEKLAHLAAPNGDAIAFDSIQPQAPQYGFHHEAVPRAHEYEQFWPIDEIMPVNTTAIVTARDALVIAFTREDSSNVSTGFAISRSPTNKFAASCFRVRAPASIRRATRAGGNCAPLASDWRPTNIGRSIFARVSTARLIGGSSTGRRR